MRRLRILTLVLALLALAPVAHAAAASNEPLQYQFSFDGAGLPTPLDTNNFPGPVQTQRLAYDDERNLLYVFDEGRLDRFNANGTPSDFEATGSPQIEPPNMIPFEADISVDNSGGPNQGNIYIFAPNNTAFWAYHPNGEPIGQGEFQPGNEGAPYPCGLGVDSNGKLWWIGYQEIFGITDEGKPTGEHFPLSLESEGFYPDGSCQPRFDRFGNMDLLASGSNGRGGYSIDVARFDEKREFKHVVTSPFELNSAKQLQVDPTTGDSYASENKQNIGGYEAQIRVSPYTDTDEQRAPEEILSGLEYANGLAFNGSGRRLYVASNNKIIVFEREPPGPPRNLTPVTIEEVRSQSVKLSSSLFWHDSLTSYRFEYGVGSINSASPVTAVPYSPLPISISSNVTGLQPDTTYHARLAATNAYGTTYGQEFVFKTYAGPRGGYDSCPNALARKQTGANTLPECRAYELVSAANTGGYEVESSLVPGQNPFPGFPEAGERLLYSTHSGAIPGPWDATNKGRDPYLATRGPEGWTTNYEGLPANLNPSAGSFSSVLGEADTTLDTFAFAGPGLCSPCFDSGLATGLPVRLANGELVQGMAGTLAVPSSATPEGHVARYLSADGSELVFASKYAFVPGANPNGLTVYERDLLTGTTQIISTEPSGAALTGAEISELGLSADGSRAVIGKRVSVDADGNEYVHPYMHVAGRAGSIDLAPGATSGVLFAGMTTDGSRVFFTTTDQLVPSDTNGSADLYEAAVNGSGNLSLRVVGGADGVCEPVANQNGPHWNTVGEEANCDTVAISGGGGVAATTGAVYFLSPEQLGGAGVLNQPNLYRAEPGGAPVFVATLEAENPLVVHSVDAAATRQTGDFQTTPTGDFAAFRSKLSIAGGVTHGYLSVYRYSAAAGTPECVSCDRTGSTEATVAAEGQLAPNGLSLTESGALFFTTAAQLQLSDANDKRDVYVADGGEPLLISAGTGPFDSALLTVSENGENVFFFTHDDLARLEDGNGTLTRIYDAREKGGFFKLPAPVACQAADECHGAGTPAPAPSQIQSSGHTTSGNATVCRKDQVKKHGRCVKRKKHKKKHHRKGAHGKKHGKGSKQAKGHGHRSAKGHHRG